MPATGPTPWIGPRHRPARAVDTVSSVAGVPAGHGLARTSCEHLRTDALTFPDQCEQDVFRTDVGVVQLQHLAQGEFQGLLRARREQDMAAALLRAGPDHRGDIDLRRLLVVPELVQNFRRHAVRHVEQPRQDVLRADVVGGPARALAE